jgi:pseudouridine-5'-phosphate glycosidase
MPFPQNLEIWPVRQVQASVAQHFRNVVSDHDGVQDNGATPATIAVLNGQIHVGLDDEALTQLAEVGHSVRKCSRRGIAHAREADLEQQKKSQQW